MNCAATTACEELGMSHESSDGLSHPELTSVPTK